MPSHRVTSGSVHIAEMVLSSSKCLVRGTRGTGAALNADVRKHVEHPHVELVEVPQTRGTEGWWRWC